MQNESKVLIRRAVTELTHLEQNRFVDSDWFEKARGILDYTRMVTVGFQHIRIKTLLMIYEHWDDVPLPDRMQFSNDFFQFAKLYTDGKDVSTIENYLGVARTWLKEGYGKGKQIEILERSPSGDPILEHGKPVTKMVEFDPLEVDLSKLLIIKRRANTDTMTPELWEMLVDDYYRCEDLRLAHQGLSGNQLPPPDQIKYTIEGPYLCLQQFGEIKPIAELFWKEYETDESVRDSIDTLLRCLNVKRDEERIDMITRKTRQERINRKRNGEL